MMYEEFMTECQMIVQTSVSDSEGSEDTVYTAGKTFSAAINEDKSKQYRSAESDRVKSLYTVTVPVSVTINFGQIFRRNKDGKFFCASADNDEKKTPERASFQFRQFTAEEFVLPGEVIQNGSSD